MTLVVNYELPCQWNQVNMERMGMGLLTCLKPDKDLLVLPRGMKIHKQRSYVEVNQKLYQGEVIQHDPDISGSVIDLMAK